MRPRRAARSGRGRGRARHKKSGRRRYADGASAERAERLGPRLGQLGRHWVRRRGRQPRRERPGLAAEKVQWLQRHDHECGDLYGMLPLIHHMPVALTDHLDRSPDKALLRGSIGKIHSWTVPRDEPSKMEQGERVLSKQPVVFVKFEGCPRKRRASTPWMH